MAAHRAVPQLRGREEIPVILKSAKRDEGSQNTKSLQFRDPSPSTRLRMTGFFSGLIDVSSGMDYSCRNQMQNSTRSYEEIYAS